MMGSDLKSTVSTGESMMTASARFVFTWVLLLVSQSILADDPASAPKPVPPANPALVQQYSAAVQAYLNSNPDAARQMAESAAQNGGIVQMGDLDLEVVAQMQQIGHSITGTVPQLQPQDATALQEKRASRDAEKAAIGKVINDHPEIMVQIVKMVVDGKNEDEAMRAIVSLGTKAIPAHLKMLEHEDSKYRTAAAQNLAFAALDDSVEYPVETVVTALSRVAQEDADPQVKEAAQHGLAMLISLLSNDNYRRNLQNTVNMQFTQVGVHP